VSDLDPTPPDRPVSPTLARRLLGWAAGRLGTPELVQDAEELFVERARRGGEPAARRWYHAQTRAALARVLLPARERTPRRRATPPWAAGLPLDAKLGVRMLLKHPGLSVVSGVGITVAVAIGAVGFGAIRTVTSSELPLDEGDRIVTIQNTRYGGLEQVRDTHLHDFASWRDEVSAFAEVGAYRVVTRNLLAPDGRVDRARTIEMTASGFRIARVPPQLGRHLIEEDEAEGAQPVVVIGHQVWRELFGGSAEVLGQTLQLGATPHTVVGVMPEGFAFPVNNRVWAPLRLDARELERGRAPDVDVFARLAPGLALSEAQAQLSVVGARAAATSPETHEGVQPRIFPYTQELFWGPMAWLLYIAQLVISLLLAVVAINVAVLTYARTQTRTGEILVRTAIGASRGRIAVQLFAEALVLSTAAAVFGLVVARSGLERLGRILSVRGGEQTPFWWDFSLSPGTVAYSLVLAAVFALIIGVVPALGATGRHLQSRLQSVGTSGATFRLGWKWTALIVLQVAVAVAVLPVSLNLAMGHWFRFGPSGPDYATGDYLWAALELDRETLPEAAAGEDHGARYIRLQSEVLARLAAEPGLSGIVAMRPAPWQDPDLRIEVDGLAASVGDPAEFQLPTGRETGWSRVGTNFLTAFGIPLIAGRGFEARDASGGDNVVIVSQAFVDRVLGGGNALGRRIRPAQSSDWTVGDLIINGSRPEGAERAWFTIIGVTPDFPRPTGPLRPEPKVYQPWTPGDSDRPSVAMRVRGEDPASYAGRLREIVAQVDPMLRVSDVATLDELSRRGKEELMLIVTVVGGVAFSVMLLSVAGLYALMSFTVLGRRREIGIRSALGARSHRILSRILSRAMAQLALGIAAGIGLAWVMDHVTGGGMLSGRAWALLPSVAVLMAGVGFLAAWGPARRVLEVQPTEALRQ
jgi:predicted permease